MSNKFDNKKSHEDAKKAGNPNMDSNKREGFERHATDTKKQGQSQGGYPNANDKTRPNAGNPPITMKHGSDKNQNQKQAQNPAHKSGQSHGVDSRNTNNKNKNK